jgi:hypothetical protein
MGQQATFTDASRIFALIVRNRERNLAAVGNTGSSQTWNHIRLAVIRK